LDITDENKQKKLTDSIPSGFDSQVDYVRGEGDVETSTPTEIMNVTSVSNSSEQQTTDKAKGNQLSVLS
jgi:hypothetical protein